MTDLTNDLKNWRSHTLAIVCFCCGVWFLFTFLELSGATHLTDGDVAPHVSEEVRHPVLIMGLFNFIQVAGITIRILNLVIPARIFELLYIILNAVWILSMAVLLGMTYVTSLHPDSDLEFTKFPFHMVAVFCYLNMAIVTEVLCILTYVWHVDEKDPDLEMPVIVPRTPGATSGVTEGPDIETGSPGVEDGTLRQRE